MRSDTTLPAFPIVGWDIGFQRIGNLALTMRVAALHNEFVTFAAIGALGFLVNLSTVYSLRGALGIYWAGAAAFVTAASFTYVANRTVTFRDRTPAATHRQWLFYLGANAIGFIFYYATYGGLVALIPLCRLFPVLPVGAGSLVGLFINFTLSRRFVFR